jgi:sugar phosphate isomerase/epimerase
MHIGIFAKTFVRPTFEEVLDAVIAHGIDTIQFNFIVAGLPSMPHRIEPEVADWIAREVGKRGITVAAVSGTFNMIDPDLSRRRRGLERLREMASACRIPHS